MTNSVCFEITGADDGRVVGVGTWFGRFEYFAQNLRNRDEDQRK